MMTAAFSLRRDSAGQLRFSDSVNREVPVVLTPAYPLSEPGGWLSLRAADGSELALVQDVRSLPSDLAAVIEEELRLRQFLPVISKVHRVSSVTTGLEVDVETDHGRT